MKHTQRHGSQPFNVCTHTDTVYTCIPRMYTVTCQTDDVNTLREQLSDDFIHST